MAFYGATYRTTYRILGCFLILASICEFANTIFFDLDLDDMNITQAQLVHHTVLENYYNNRRELSTSNLGTILFKNIDPVMFRTMDREAQLFKISVWMVWTDLVATYLQKARFDNLSVTREALEKCSVKNCMFYSSYSALDIKSADAVIFTTQISRFPLNFKKNPRQRWILWSRGHPAHKISLKWSHRALEAISGFFNWTMSYRTDSDIPIPYGRTVPLRRPADVDFNDAKGALSALVPYWNRKQTGTLAMTIVDECIWEYNELKKFLNIDVYFKSCPLIAKMDCVLPEQYLFYIAFEDSSCRQYISETVFHHAYSKGAIPLIIGIPLQDCETLLPPNSFIHAEQFQSISDLVMHMKEIASDYAKLLRYHKWRRHFSVDNEHGLYTAPSLYLCRVCEALNYNDGGNKWYNYDELSLFYDEKLFCDFIHKCRV